MADPSWAGLLVQGQPCQALAAGAEPRRTDAFRLQLPEGRVEVGDRESDGEQRPGGGVAERPGQGVVRRCGSQEMDGEQVGRAADQERAAALQGRRQLQAQPLVS